MKTLTIIMMGFVLLSLFAVAYNFILEKTNYGVMDYNEYQKGKCEFKHLSDGSAQLENCAVYKYNRDYP